MRIAIDARMVRVTGIGRYIECLSRELRNTYSDVTMLTSPEDKMWWHANYPSAVCLEIPDRFYSWSEQLMMPTRLQKQSFDLVHFTNFNVPLSLRTPYVVTIHDLTPLTFGGERRRGWLNQRAYQQVLARGLARAERIIVPSEMIKRQLLAWAPFKKISVIPHGISHEFLVPPSDEATKQRVLEKFGIREPFMLYVGNLRAHKNIPALLQGFAMLRGTFPSARLVITGPSTYNQTTALTNLQHQLKIETATRLTGPINNSDLIALYDAARLFVLPSFSEGYGLVALEAASRGLPVVVSETTPVREFLGRTVFSFNPKNANMLGDLLVMVWNDEALRGQRAAMAKVLATTRTWHDVARETSEIYQLTSAAKVKPA